MASLGDLSLAGEQSDHVTLEAIMSLKWQIKLKIIHIQKQGKMIFFPLRYRFVLYSMLSLLFWDVSYSIGWQKEPISYVVR